MLDYKEMSPEEAVDLRASEIDVAYEQAREFPNEATLAAAQQELKDQEDKAAAETSFLEEDAAGPVAQAVLKDVSDKAKRLLELKWEMEEKEEAFNEAKKQYDEYRCVTLPTFMEMSGLNRIDTIGGAIIEVDSKYYCKPNKNQADLDTIEAFLKEHKGDHLVKKGATVETAFLDRLKEAQVPFTEIREFDTNSLKAWLKDQIGANGGQAQFEMKDIPNCMHFIRMKECNIKV